MPAFSSLLAISPFASLVVAVNFEKCLLDIQNGNWTEGALDHVGNPVTDVKDAVAISYDLCLKACGSGFEPFDWPTFYLQFSSWLLPYLALISQLPFGAEYRLSNFISICLTIGSPTLAAYSLALTVLNGRWITHRFRGVTYPNADKAAYVLRTLQQSPIRINADGPLLASLVVLPENDEWWTSLYDALHNFSSTWSVAGIMSIGWVVISYILTVIDSSRRPAEGAQDALAIFGQGVGLAWFWLVPVVVGWVQLAPKCDANQLRWLFKTLNILPHVAGPEGSASLKSAYVSSAPPLSIDPAYDDPTPEQAVHHDAQLCSPIYNYSRVFSHDAVVEHVASMFAAAAANARQRRPVDDGKDWVPVARSDVHPENRTGTAEQITQYCTRDPDRHPPHGESEVYQRILIASTCALLLQWGNTGAAMTVLILAPTTGLSCKSGSFLVHGVLSTFVWALLIASSILARRAYPDAHRICHRAASGTRPRPVSATLSIGLRRFGKVLAVLNTFWLLGVNVLQFANVFTTCWCQSCVLSRGARHAYNVVRAMPPDIALMHSGWIGAIALSTGSALFFIVFINMLRDRKPVKL